MLSPVPVAGIDAGKHCLDLGFFPAAKPLRCDNAPAGIAQLITALRQRGVLTVALESIGPYAQPLVTALVAAGFSVAPPRFNDHEEGLMGDRCECGTARPGAGSIECLLAALALLALRRWRAA